MLYIDLIILILIVSGISIWLDRRYGRKKTEKVF